MAANLPKYQWTRYQDGKENVEFCATVEGVEGWAAVITSDIEGPCMLNLWRPGYVTNGYTAEHGDRTKHFAATDYPTGARGALAAAKRWCREQGAD